MNTILLHPTDVLFFRDGRPMGGASSGHGAAWPLPSVINQALHAALHRSGITSHKHAPGRSSDKRDYSDANREQNGRQFGSLVTAGPFPVRIKDAQDNPIPPVWHFPRPADADDAGEVVSSPCAPATGAQSSLRPPAKYPVVSRRPPSKGAAKPWWTPDLWRKYLGHQESSPSDGAVDDTCFSDVEHSYGIEISPDTGSVVESRFYSAHYLRLHPGWSLGIYAEAGDKAHGGQDIIPKLISQDCNIVTGGQQRACTAERRDGELPALPLGAQISGARVKWVLLTPAIFPLIEGDESNGITAHAGGWLPNWIAEKDQSFEGETVEAGSVLLLDGPGKEKAKRKKVSAGRRIQASLVAAIVGKPVPVTGYALPNSADPDRQEGGSKPTHLAVPAGAVYYFECASEPDAKKLAAALNWHGADTNPATIKNRRSTLMGEKGFGLGVCGTWSFHGEKLPS